MCERHTPIQPRPKRKVLPFYQKQSSEDITSSREKHRSTGPNVQIEIATDAFVSLTNFKDYNVREVVIIARVVVLSL